MRPTLPMTGGCPCGAIRYEIASYPLLLYTCHLHRLPAAIGQAWLVPAAPMFTPSAQPWVRPPAGGMP